MAHAGEELQDPSGQRLVYIATSESTAGARLEMEWFVPPGRRLAAVSHFHPDGPEHWEIVSGTAGYRVGKQEHVESAPHEWTVPGNTPHVHPWNAGDDVLHVRQTIAADPPMPELIEGVAGYFETMFALAQRGKVRANGQARNPLQDALTIHTLLMPGTYLAGPPVWAQRVLFGSLAAIARVFGMDAHIPPQTGNDGG